MPYHDRKSTRLNSSHLVISYAVSLDRKSTRLNSSHLVISYAVFCLKKKKSTRPRYCNIECNRIAVITTRVHSSDLLVGGWWYHHVTSVIQRSGYVSDRDCCSYVFFFYLIGRAPV